MGLSFRDIGGKLRNGLGKLRKAKPAPPEPVEAVKAPKLSGTWAQACCISRIEEGGKEHR